MSYLLDTNVISEPRRKLPNENVVQWLAGVEFADVYLSALTVGEIKKGAAKLPSGKQKVALESWLEKLRREFAERILPVTEETFLVWGKMVASFENVGIVRPAFDSLLEATALEHDLILVTRKVRNFRGSSVTIMNPWED